ncbi:MAG TPA: hypothetical protein VEW48_08195 [Thermoanaerobaculia bacterium]|nr:hypothetical protein [Thermoanaerobaculia bacterium]
MNEDASAAEPLLEELLSAATPEERFHLLREQERFHSLALAEVLLQQSAEAQLAAPDEALLLARLAGHLAPHLAPAQVADGVLARALCLEGNAHRLNGDLDLAAEAFVSAVPALVEPVNHAAFSRGLGLVRWEQGRPDEAVALLGYAVGLYELTADERDTTSLLQGVLLAELGFAGAAAEVLANIPPPNRHPALCGRAVLSLAGAVEEDAPNRDGYTRYLLEKGMSVYPLLAGDTDELTSLYRLEARAKARLGQTEEARATLGGLRNHYLETRDLPELALATIDLLALQVAAGEIPSVVPFRRDLETFEPEEGGPLAQQALDRMFASGAEDPWDGAWETGAWLLCMLRFSRIPTRPIQFA